MGAVCSQEAREEFSVMFRVNSTVIDPGFAGNAQQIARMIDFLQAVNRNDSIWLSSVSFRGTTSLEGSYEINHRLGRRRLAAFEEIVRREVDIPDSLITRDDYYLPWSELAEWVRNSDLQQKEQALAIISEPAQLVPFIGRSTIDSRIQKLRYLDNGRVWHQMNSQYFRNMRSASSVVTTYRDDPYVRPAEPEPELPPLAEAAPEELEQVDLPAPEPEPEPEPAPAEPERLRHWHLKTNAVGWALSMVNLAAEVDLCDHVSAALPIYYSGADYFIEERKFRIFGFYPEVRYWLHPENDGFFVGGHFGMAWYNFAFNGAYRYQDHARHTPAVGGGVSVGYRMPITSNKRWRVEFAVGAGVYDLHYDEFYNIHNGKIVDIRGKKKTYIGLDQVAITFGYTFDMKKKGGKK